MNRVTHSMRGLDALRARLAALPATAENAAGDALGDVAEGAAEDVRGALLQSTGGARSLPGALPADPKGRLAAAVRVARHPDRPGSTVTVDLPFAHYLEFGTVKMAPRPFLRPAMLQAGRNAGATLGAALRGAAASLKGPAR